jgi:hypothetical protein
MYASPTSPVLPARVCDACYAHGTTPSHSPLPSCSSSSPAPSSTSTSSRPPAQRHSRTLPAPPPPDPSLPDAMTCGTTLFGSGPIFARPDKLMPAPPLPSPSTSIPMALPKTGAHYLTRAPSFSPTSPHSQPPRPVARQLILPVDPNSTVQCRLSLVEHSFPLDEVPQPRATSTLGCHFR